MTNEYLYGEDIEVPNIPEDIINRRIKLLNRHLKRLLDVSYRERDLKRVSDILKAIKYWETINLK